VRINGVHYLIIHWESGWENYISGYIITKFFQKSQELPLKENVF